jgi:hypothetical protein
MASTKNSYVFCPNQAVGSLVASFNSQTNAVDVFEYWPRYALAGNIRGHYSLEEFEALFGPYPIPQE